MPELPIENVHLDAAVCVPVVELFDEDVQTAVSPDTERVGAIGQIMPGRQRMQGKSFERSTREDRLDRSSDNKGTPDVFAQFHRDAVRYGFGRQASTGEASASTRLVAISSRSPPSR